MVIAPFLAMTEAEIRANPDICSPMAWMACHFSAYGTGLSNLPDTLPEGSLLILNDRTPWYRHDPERIAAQLEDCLERLACRGLLLDFQRPVIPEVAQLSAFLSRRLTLPVAVSVAYAAELEGPVFLPPVPLQQTVQDYLAPWQSREIWLELALDCEEILLTPEGAVTAPLPACAAPKTARHDEIFHCCYRVRLEETSARFTLSRTKDDLNLLLEEAAKYGVTTAVGLWQELS